MTLEQRGVAVVAALGVLAAWTAVPGGGAHDGRTPSSAGAGCGPPAADSSEILAMAPLHREPMETTRHAPGARGTMVLAYAPSPFGLTVAGDGRPVYRIGLEVAGLRTASGRVPVVWAATPELDRVVRLGTPGADGTLTGRLEWTRFLVFVTAESGAEKERWSGPVLLVGRSPSTRMHTMRGHGIFEAHGIGC